MKFGIIGPGTIANSFAQSMELCEGVELYAVASRDMQRAKEFAEKYGATVAYDSYEALIADENVEAVYIATPHNSHVKYTDMCLENNKAVICEKPYALSYEEAVNTAALSKKNNVLFMEGMWSRFHPAYAVVKKWIADGKIGDMKLIDLSFAGCSEVDPDSRIFNKELGGGALFDLGVYCIEYSMGIADCTNAKVTGVATIGSTGVDEVDSISMLFDYSVVAHMTCGVRVSTKDNCTIYGTEGRIEIYRFWNTHKVNLYNSNNEIIDTFEDEEVPGIPKCFSAEIEAFRDTYNSGAYENDVMPHADTIACAKYFDLLRENWGLK